MAFQVNLANRLSKLPPYLFAEIDAMKQQALKEGKDIINLGVGDPDLPTPPHIVESLKNAVEDPSKHHYPSYVGMPAFRESMANYYKNTRNIELNPATEVQSLIGAKEGVGHIPLAFVDPGDIVLIPDPAYPVYESGTYFAGGEPYFMPLLAENGFLPDIDAVPADILDRAKLMFINYPNNPISAVCDMSFFEKVIAVAKKHNIIVIHDAAYADVVFDGYRMPSFLETPGAKDVGIEIYSLSKTYNMTGWRIAAALGNAEIVGGLGKIKTNLDSGVFEPIQHAAITALDSSQDCVIENNKIFQDRRDVLVDGLNSIGWKVDKPKATFYVWIRIPEGAKSSEITKRLIQEAAIVTTPGNGFGPHGEGYIRMTITTPKDRLEETVSRMAKMQF